MMNRVNAELKTAAMGLTGYPNPRRFVDAVECSCSNIESVVRFMAATPAALPVRMGLGRGNDGAVRGRATWVRRDVD